MIRRLKQLLTFINDTKSYFYPGLILFFFLFLLNNYINFSVTYMGNKSDAVVDFIYEHYLFETLIVFIKIMFVYLITGIVFSIIFYRACEELKKRMNYFKGRFSPLLLTVTALCFYYFILLFGLLG